MKGGNGMGFVDWIVATAVIVGILYGAGIALGYDRSEGDDK